VQLVITEVSQIQPYIFASNRMRENVGASFLVMQATEGWALETVNKVSPRNNIINISPAGGKSLDGRKRIDDPADALDAEVLYAGGGNFVALFRNENYAKEFIRLLSRKILTDAPGLQLTAVQQPYQWTEPLYLRLMGALEELEQKKRAWAPSAPLLGLGVTVMCRSTGMPAIEFRSSIEPQLDDDPDYPVSAEIIAKLQGVSGARTRLRKMIPPPKGYMYPVEIDHLGYAKGEYSHIAVVHIDGNDMGRRKKEIGEEYKDSSQNRGYIRAIRAFSESVAEASRKALMAINDKIVNCVMQEGEERFISYKNKNIEKEGKQRVPKVVLKYSNEGAWCLPVIPVVYGGDDVTFICNGRLGISLAIEYIREFEKETKASPACKNKKITSSAGIAIVKSHHPFAQAYRLAEELCSSAKRYRRKESITGSCLDWHFAVSGLSDTLENMRQREYKVKRGWLTLRPVALDENEKQVLRSWQVINKGIIEFREPDWFERRNKLKALREALRLGGDAVSQFLLKYEPKGLPIIDASLLDLSKRGWWGEYCGYFDAIELADWFIPLEEDGQ